MSFVNVGAYVNGQRPKTKKALKDALANDLASVSFDGTDAYNFQNFTGEALVGELATGTKLTVVGPDPYRDRRWYAQVELNPKTNKIIVK